MISLEIKTRPVNGPPVVCGDGLIFYAAAVFLTIVPILMAAEALAGVITDEELNADYVLPDAFDERVADAIANAVADAAIAGGVCRSFRE